MILFRKIGSLVLGAGLFCLFSCAPMRTTALRLHYAPETAQAKAIIENAFQHYYVSAMYLDYHRLPSRADVEVQPLIANYRLSAEDCLSGQGLAAAKPLDYLCYLKTDGNVVGRIDIPVDEKGALQNGMLWEINARELAGMKQILDGLRQVETLEALHNGSYELRILSLPPYDAVHGGRLIRGYVMWLKSDPSNADLIYTFPHRQSSGGDDPPNLQPDTIYTPAQMLELIRPAVQKFQDSAESKLPHWTD